MNVLIDHTITAVCLQSFSATKWSEKSISATLKKQIKLSPRLVYLLFFKSHFQTFKLLLNIFKVISLLLCTSIHIFKVCACVSRVKRGSNMSSWICLMCLNRKILTCKKGAMDLSTWQKQLCFLKCFLKCQHSCLHSICITVSDSVEYNKINWIS